MDRQVLKTEIIAERTAPSNAKGKLNMAKIDVSRIDNFDTMSTEDKLTALLNYEYEAPKADESAELTRVRNALNKATGEAAEYKRALREKQSEAERAEADRLERENALQEELKAYRVKERVSTYKAQLMAIGYDATTADVMANALPEGVSDEFFATQKTFLDGQRQKIVTETINKQPGLSVGTPPTTAQAETEQENVWRKHMGLPLR